MTMTLDTSNRISINGAQTGLAIDQSSAGTIVFTPADIGIQYKRHPMPHARYSTAHDAPASGVPGRAQLEADIVALMNAAK